MNNTNFVFNESEYLNYLDEVVEDMHSIYDNHIFILDELLNDKKLFKKVYNDAYNFMKKGFEHKEVRSFKVCYMFSKTDIDVYEMEIRHMITNMIFWRTF